MICIHGVKDTWCFECALDRAPLILPPQERRAPKRDPHIFASRYWNSGSAAVAIIAVYGGLARYECLGCSAGGGSTVADVIQAGVVYQRPVCLHEGEDKIQMFGDWSAYIAATPETEWQEDAENNALRSGTKLDKAFAEFLFAGDLKDKDNLRYRR
jgi:hypothetical protein